MPDEEAIREYIMEFMVTFERLTPWLVLESTEKGKPVKPNHRVSYYQLDEEARAGTHEYYSPLKKVVSQIWDAEKKLPMDLTFRGIAFNQSRTGAFAFIDYNRYDRRFSGFGYTFLFWKIEGQWRFRLAHGYRTVII
jgi:hypothetical protein